MDTPCSPLLQPFRCETQIFRHVDTQGRSAITRLSRRVGLLLSRWYIHRCKTHFTLTVFVKHFTYIGHTHFIITGHFDNTTCFHCGIELRDWVPADVPFAEQAKVVTVHQGSNLH
jgi:hypothetical protein